MKERKGIILAGGTGTRLYPITITVSKQLIPIYDKPMIYYPLSTLMLAGIRNVLIICTPYEIQRFTDLLKDGSQWGMNIQYAVQSSPDGLVQAFIIGKEFINNQLCTLILGDNIFYGHDLSNFLVNVGNREEGATVFAYHVEDPSNYGVVEFDDQKNVVSIVEKPNNPLSNYAVTGLYFYDTDVCDLAFRIKPSQRGELEITDLNRLYLECGKLKVEIMERGYTWLDTGTHDNLLEASSFVATLQNRQGLMISCPEEIAYLQKWIDEEQITRIAEALSQNRYGQYLLSRIQELTYLI
jgi:glucose-1-phosphate thymidylyltransferase